MEFDKECKKFEKGKTYTYEEIEEIFEIAKARTRFILNEMEKNLFKKEEE